MFQNRIAPSVLNWRHIVLFSFILLLSACSNGFEASQSRTFDASLEDVSLRQSVSGSSSINLGGSYRIVSSCGNGDKVVSVGAFPKIALAPKGTGADQVFEASQTNNGFELKSKSSGKVIGIASDATFSGARIEQRTSSGHATQRFVASDLGGGLVSIRNSGSGYFLNLLYDQVTDGTGFNQSSFWNTCGQKFKLESVLSAERSAYSTIQAESFTSQNGSQTENGAVGYLDSGDYLHYRAVGFDDGAKSLSLSVAVPSTAAGKKIEVRLDSKTGTLVGSLTVQNTGGWSTFKTQSINLSTTVTGIHDLYLVMAGGSDVANIDSFVFSKQSLVVAAPPPTVVADRSAFTTIQAENYTSQSGSQVESGAVGYLDSGDFLHFKAIGFDDGAKSVSFVVAVPSTAAGKKIEVRLDSKTGTLVGSLTVQNTGGWSSFQAQAINLSTTVTGVRDLYLVMSGGSDVANIDSFVFSRQSISPTAPTPEPAPTQTPSQTSASNIIDTLVTDMKLYHDGPVRTLQYIKGWGSGWDFPRAIARPSGWTTAGPWGVIMADTDHANGSNPPSPWRVAGPHSGNQAPNTRAQVRDIQLWWLKSDGTWVLGSHNKTPGGYMYLTSWAGEATSSQNAFRDEATNGGGRSARYINMNAGGYNFDSYHWHFFGSRAQVPSGYIGFATGYFARKILHDPNGPDDRAKARLLADTAGDWWITKDAQWDNFKTNWPMGFNRFKYLTNDWQLIGFHSLTEAQIRANPPPFIGAP